MEGITFTATVEKVQTVKAGGWRVTLDVPPSDSQAMISLAEIIDRTFLQVACVPNDLTLHTLDQ